MSRLMALVLTCSVFAFTAGCSGDSGTASDDMLAQETVTDTVAGDAVAGDVVIPPLTFMPPALQLQSFTVILEADQTLGTAGKAFVLNARVGRGEASGEVTWSWDVEGWEPEGETGESATVTFAEEGHFLAEVTAEDSEGNRASAGVLLTVFPTAGAYVVGDVDDNGAVEQADVDLAAANVAGQSLLTVEQWERADVTQDNVLDDEDVVLIQEAADAGADAPVALWPAEGSLGVRVRLIHPALLDPDVQVQVQFSGSDPMTPVRGKPGYAAFVLPPDQDKATDSTISLLVDGEVADQFDFKVLALPPASENPGEKVVRAFEELDELLTYMPDLIAVYGDAVEMTDDEKAVLQGMLQVALNSYSANRVEFIAAFEMMEDEGRAAFEQVAMANGLDDVLADIQEMRTYLESVTDEFGLLKDQMSMGTASTLLGILCVAHQVADISSKVAEINEIASGYLDWFDWWPLNKAPIVGQVITFLSSLSTAIGAITDIIGVVAEYLPEFGELEVEAKPAALNIGATAGISASIEIIIGTKLCNKAAGAGIESLMGTLESALSKRLGSMIPIASSAFKKAKWDKDNMGSILGLVYDAVSAISGAILDALGIQEVLEGLAEKICDLIDDPNLPVEPDQTEASCGGAGKDSWTCTTACIGSVSLTSSKEVCGSKKKGSASVECIGCTPENCTGCCDGDVDCLAFPQQTSAKCGAGGAPCAACPEHHDCTGGACVCTSNCDQAGAKKCQGNSVYICTIVVAAPQCMKWTLEGPCINGAECKDGKCEGGCHSENCAGCCQGDGTCIDPPTKDNCGINGETCGYCPPGDDCVNGVCTCAPNCDGVQCGSDGCEGSCGSCDPVTEICENGQCVCIPQCDGKVCGPDGCGASCGSCPDGLSCVGGECVEGPKMCKCGAPGVTLDGSGCDWPDATACTGWHSVATENGVDYEGEFADGTALCAWGCCIKIVCP